MTRAPQRVWTRRIAFAVGLALAAAGIFSLQVTNGSERLGANLTMETTSTGELLVRPNGSFLSGRHLTAGELAEGRVRVRNQTGTVLAVRVRTVASSRDLDHALLVRAYADGRLIFDGQLGELRSWSSRAFEVNVSQSADVRMVVSVAGGGGYEGRTAEARLEFRSKPLGTGS
jgi:hypothetical protein